MNDDFDPSGSGTNGDAPRQIEESSTAPRLDEAESPSVDADDSVKGDESPVLSCGDDEEDPWLDVMQDLARLVIGAFEADPHRFR